MQDDTIEIHIRACVPPGAETERLLADLIAYAWPGGTQDHTDPAARGWLRHFRAVRPIVVAAECSCQAGRCSSCN
jgi:hypothetical protein